jgi:hypothetical protein
VFDPRPLRASYEIFLKLLDVVSRAFSNGFDHSIRTIADVSQNLVPRCGALREKAITNALHVTPDEKLPRHLCHRLRQSRSRNFHLPLALTAKTPRLAKQFKVLDRF